MGAGNWVSVRDSSHFGRNRGGTGGDSLEAVGYALSVLGYSCYK